MTTRFAKIIALCALLHSVQAHAGHYTATVSPDLRSLHVRACFDVAPTNLRAGDRAANRYLNDLVWHPGHAQPLHQGSRIELNADSAAGCLNYRVDVGAAADQQVLRRTQWAGDDLITTPELWLWRDTGESTLKLALPDNVHASVPWPPTGNANEYRIAPTPRQWAAQMALGRLRLDTLDIRGSTLHVALADPASLEHPDEVVEWVEQTAKAIATVYGAFPRNQTQVLVIPGKHTSPVPWGQVLRGGAPAVQFYVAQDATRATLNADWTAFHELSHLFLPFVQRKDAYVSEGFASYFQNITRGRSGNLSREQAWAKLVAGFERGRRDTDNQTLQAAARTMGREGNYMRVYWSGAALALMADVQLRQQTGKGLDQLLGQLRDCCLDDHKAWPAARLARELDRLSKTDIVTTLNNDLSRARSFPDVRPLLRKLGVLVDGDQVRLDDTAPLAEIRTSIMTPASQTKDAARAASQ